MRAKLQRLAQKYSTVSTDNMINKPDYGDNLAGSGSSDSAPKRSKYWKSMQVKDGHYEPISTAVEVSDTRNETGTKEAALNNVTYSETVHDSADENSVSDGQESDSGVTVESIIRKKWQENPKNETEPGTNSVAGISMTGKNKTKIDNIRKRRFDIALNEIPTFPHGEPFPKLDNGMMFQKPGIQMENPEINRLYGYSPWMEQGRRVSQNERYSKVGRDPPYWVPVEPIGGEPVLREPVNKGTILEEPFEPIPPLSKKDIDIVSTQQKSKSTSETEPDVVASLVKRTGESVRRRPEAKEGGPPELGKIASPLELEWIREAETSATTVGTSQNGTETTPGFPRNETADQRIQKDSEAIENNQTKQKSGLERSQKSQSNDEKTQINTDEKDCTTTSWKNVQLIQDALSGGYYVIQAKTRSNCSEEDEATFDKEQPQMNGDEEVFSVLQKEDIIRASFDQAPAETHDSTSTNESGEAGWMFFGTGGKMAKEPQQPVKHTGEGKPRGISSTKDFPQNLVNSKDVNFQRTQLEDETFPVDEFEEDLLKYYAIGADEQLQTGQDSAGKDEVLNLDNGFGVHLVDQEETDLISNRGEESEIHHVDIRDGVIWHRGPENPRKIGDDVLEGDFEIVDEAHLNLAGDGGTEKTTELNAGVPRDPTAAEPVPLVVPAAFHANSRSHIGSISGQTVTWGNTCSLSSSDIPVTETQTDTEMIDISKTLLLKLILKRFSILILYTYRNDHVKN